MHFRLSPIFTWFALCFFSEASTLEHFPVLWHADTFGLDFAQLNFHDHTFLKLARSRCWMSVDGFYWHYLSRELDEKDEEMDIDSSDFPFVFYIILLPNEIPVLPFSLQ